MRRFWDKVDKRGTADCWEWLASKNEFGYGRFGYGRVASRAHRVSWILHYGDIADGMDVCHTCDNPACVNPTHLFLGTAKDNMSDASQKGRMAHGEKHYRSKLTEEQVIQARIEYRAGGVTHQELADRYGVAKAVIGYMLRRQTWSHI